MRNARTTLLAIAALALAAAGCGGNEVAADEVPGDPPALTVPSDSELGAGAADADEAAESGTTGEDEDPAAAEDAAGTTGEAAPEAPATDAEAGGAVAPETEAPAPEEAAADPAQPQADSPPEQFEDFCEQNEGAC